MSVNVSSLSKNEELHCTSMTKNQPVKAFCCCVINSLCKNTHVVNSVSRSLCVYDVKKGLQLLVIPNLFCFLKNGIISDSSICLVQSPALTQVSFKMYM